MLGIVEGVYSSPIRISIFLGFSHPFNELTIPLIDPERESLIKGF
jgi:hypothetical protein